jgi:hypothetical protein
MKPPPASDRWHDRSSRRWGGRFARLRWRCAMLPRMGLSTTPTPAYGFTNLAIATRRRAVC